MSKKNVTLVGKDFAYEYEINNPSDSSSAVIDAFEKGFEKGANYCLKRLPSYEQQNHACGKYIQKLPKDLGETAVLNRQRGFVKACEYFDSIIERLAEEFKNE